MESLKNKNQKKRKLEKISSDEEDKSVEIIDKKPAKRMIKE